MQELVDILQAEQHQLDLLHYRLTVLGLVLEGGDLRHIRRATADTGAARQRLREVDLLRATAALLHVVDDADSDAVPTARELAARAPHPWAGILRDQHETLASLVSEVEVAGFHTAERARSAIHVLAAAEDPADDSDAPPGGDAPGTTRTAARPAAALSRSGARTTWRRAPFDDTGDPDDHDLLPLTAERALQDALQAAGRLRVPSLLAFLQ